jgi:hypothetical protein
MLGTAGRSSDHAAAADAELHREIEVIATVVAERGEVDREELARTVRASEWGPGSFRSALHEAVREGRVRHPSRSTFGPP